MGGKTKYGPELSHFSDKDRHCPYCLNTLGRRVDKLSYTGVWNAPKCQNFTGVWPKSMASTRRFLLTLRIYSYGKNFIKVLTKSIGIMGVRPFFKIINISTTHH